MKTYIDARKFAQALLICAEDTSRVYQELEALSKEWKKLALFLPQYVPDSQKQTRIRQLECCSEIETILLMLSKQGRLRLLPAMFDAYARVQNEEQKRADAYVKTTRELTQDECVALQTQLERKYKKQIRLNQIIDETIIGGLKIETNFCVQDDTTQMKLQRMRDVLRREMEALI